MSSFSVESIENQLKQRLGRIQGTDTNGDDYHSLTELWDYIFHAQSIKQKTQKRRKKSDGIDTNKEMNSSGANEWYHKAFEYWESAANCPISDDGVLGGYGKLTPMDVRDSNIFLDKMQTLFPAFQLNKVADCGAGIGRVTKFLLLPRSRHVDLIEQSPRLLSSAPAYIGVTEGDQSRIGLIEKGLQDFAPEQNSYDLIWIQWVIGHLHDEDFVQFFRRCAMGLTPSGFIILKDNTITDRNLTFSLDLEDNSVARNLEYQKLLFDLAGLEVVQEQLQKDFPEELYPVYMIALRAKSATAIVNA